MMDWLKYPEHKAQFVFIYNKAEDLEESEKLECLGQMCGALGADARFTCVLPSAPGQSPKQVKYTLATGFPRRAKLDAVRESLQLLNDAVLYLRENHGSMWVGESWCPIL